MRKEKMEKNRLKTLLKDKLSKLIQILSEIQPGMIVHLITIS